MLWPRHPVLIVNPRSGGGTAERLDVARECRARGIEPFVLQPGDNLLTVAEAAVSQGTDAIGVAGGDGSQAVVADVASRHNLPFVCVPAGTRNHFAFDIGIDRADVVGALDAFARGAERRIDLARVNGRTFINNASLGAYAEIVQSESYRNAKVETVARVLPEVLPPRAEAFDFGFDAPDGVKWHGPQLMLVSNNPYRLPRPGIPGTRRGIDRGVLGVIAARTVGARELLALMATETTGSAPRFPGWLEFSTASLTVDAGSPVDVALDGEACVLDPPLRFESVPRALRLRVLNTNGD